MNLHDYIEKNTPLGLFGRINVFQEYNPDIHDIEQKILQLKRLLSDYEKILEILNSEEELKYYKKKRDRIPSREDLKMRGMNTYDLQNFKNNLKPTY